MDKKEWFISRWKALGDMEDVLAVAAPAYKEPKQYLKELILEEENETLADKRLTVLENIVKINFEEVLKIKLKRLRFDRDSQLRETDYTQLGDSPISNENKKMYREYRLYLRELPFYVESNRIRLEEAKVTLLEWSKWNKSTKYTRSW